MMARKQKMRFWLARDRHPDGVLTLFCGSAPFQSGPGYWHSSDPHGGGHFRMDESDVRVELGKRVEVAATIDVKGVAVRPLKG